MADLKIKFLGVDFENPTVLASGILGVTASSLKNVVRNGAGGVTTKSIWLEEHKGHKNPTMLGNEHYFLNAVGLSDAGIDKAKETFAEYNEDKPAPLIASIVAYSKKDFAEL
ncbi:MAG: dihydroorotate dehydrogenase, partial [Patescibacteria group bacterium]